MRIEVMSVKGDETLAEWGAETSAERLRAIELSFRGLCDRGYRAFGAQSGERFDTFDPQCREDLVFIAPLVGG